MASPTFVAAGANTANSGATITAPAPAGVALNDFLIALAQTYGTGVPIGTPGGWSLGASLTGGFYTYYAFYKFAGASEGSVVMTQATSHAGNGQMLGWRGVSLATPLDAAMSFGAESATVNVPFPSVMTTQADSKVVYLGFSDSAIAWDTPPNLATEQSESGIPSISKFIVADLAEPSPGTVPAGNYVRNSAGSGTFNVGISLALLSASAPTPAAGILLPYSVSGGLRF